MFQKKALICSLITGAAILGFSAVASADLPGFYAGGELGWSNLTTSYNPFKSDFQSGLGAGAQVGYQFNNYIAAEAGYLYFHNYSQNYSEGWYPDLHLGYKEQAVDLVAKGIIPITNCFNIYGKAGAAYVDARATGSTFFGSPGGGGFTISNSQTTTPIRPVYGIGVSYDITPNVSADLSWTRVQKNNSIPNADLTALGLTYHFG